MIYRLHNLWQVTYFSKPHVLIYEVRVLIVHPSWSCSSLLYEARQAMHLYRKSPVIATSVISHVSEPRKPLPPRKLPPAPEPGFWASVWLNAILPLTFSWLCASGMSHNLSQGPTHTSCWALGRYLTKAFGVACNSCPCPGNETISGLCPPFHLWALVPHAASPTAATLTKAKIDPHYTILELLRISGPSLWFTIHYKLSSH